jgi:hypothetical protein
LGCPDQQQSHKTNQQRTPALPILASENNMGNQSSSASDCTRSSVTSHVQCVGFLNEDGSTYLESPIRSLAATETSFTKRSSRQDQGGLGQSRLLGRTRRHKKDATRSKSIDHDLYDVLAFLEHVETKGGKHKPENVAIKRMKKPTSSELLFLSEMAKAA